LDFLLENMYKTCVYLHFKIEIFVKICAKNILFFNLRACINAYVSLSLKTYIKHSKINRSA
jgi:hypothetical protein